jgi:hypothetical protein
MNWPGADITVDTLMSIDKRVLIPYIEDALLKADKDNRMIWIGWIKHLIIDMGITYDDFINKEIYNLLGI